MSFNVDTAAVELTFDQVYSARLSLLKLGLCVHCVLAVEYIMTHSAVNLLSTEYIMTHSAGLVWFVLFNDKWSQ